MTVDEVVALVRPCGRVRTSMANGPSGTARAVATLHDGLDHGAATWPLKITQNLECLLPPMPDAARIAAAKLMCWVRYPRCRHGDEQDADASVTLFHRTLPSDA